MYRSDTKPRVKVGSTVFAIVKMLKGRRVCYRVFSVESMNPPAQEFIQAQVPTLLQSSHSSMSTSTSRCDMQQRKIGYHCVIVFVIILVCNMLSSNALYCGGCVVTLLDDDQGVLCTAFLPHVSSVFY